MMIEIFILPAGNKEILREHLATEQDERQMNCSKNSKRQQNRPERDKWFCSSKINMEEQRKNDRTPASDEDIDRYNYVNQ